MRQRNTKTAEGKENQLKKTYREVIFYDNCKMFWHLRGRSVVFV